MLDILYIIIYLIVLALISLLFTKLTLWFLPAKNRNTMVAMVIFFAAMIILGMTTIFFSSDSLVTMQAPRSSGSNADNLQLDKLVKGRIAYYIPDTMELSKSYKATVTISKSGNDRILFQSIDSTGYIKDSLTISSRVKMFLIDPTGNKHFKINSLNTEEQLVDDSTNTIWKWNVIPLKSGDNELILRTTVKVLDELGENYRDIPVFEKHIKVNASIIVVTRQFISHYWQWLTTVCFIPLIVWVYNRFYTEKSATDQRVPIRSKAKKQS